jgi:GPI mannosyltransferase 1 subunit M
MTFFSSPPLLFTASIVLRVILLLWGLYQDATSPLKYTDIDYFVFTDAARYIASGISPYARATYRYTPLLAYILIPTTWSPQWLWFHFGKILFAAADIVAGWLILLILRQRGMELGRAGKFASIWLLNPMVATISTRGSSEGLLGVMTMALLWAVLNRRLTLAGTILGLAVHFKIYPFIYATSIMWYLESPTAQSSKPRTPKTIIVDFINESRLALTLSALSTFSTLNLAMFILHGMPFMQHTYLYHLTRTDHRHNFSPYNILLYLSSSRSAANPSAAGIGLESLAFIPQLLLSAVLIPLVCAKKDLAGTMLAQTWAFVAFNKVCTSQVFPLPSSPTPHRLRTTQLTLNLVLPMVPHPPSPAPAHIALPLIA